MKKSLFSVLVAVGVLAAGVSAPTAASAATTATVCAEGCDFATIQAAVNASTAGDTIVVTEDLAVSGLTTINKDVTVTGGENDVTVTQTASTITFLLSGAGATLSNLAITSDTPKAVEFIQIGANDVTLRGNTIYGPAQALPMSKWVVNRGFVTQGGITGFTAARNVMHSMRSGSYLNPNGTGVIADNTVYNTKGDFLIDNANFTFTDNQAGDASKPSEWGFVVFGSTAPDRYTELRQLSSDNNWMTALDQRSGETYVPAPANPQAQIAAVCGAATVTLTNATVTDGTDPADAQFTVIVDGVASTETVAPDDTKTVTATFPEDSGDHNITVYAGDEQVASATVHSDCAISNKDECKAGRWAEAGLFKNQGQCVSSFTKSSGRNEKR